MNMFIEFNITNDHMIMNENTFFTMFLSLYLPICILFTGTIGNIFCFLIFFNLSKRKSEFFTYNKLIKSIRYIFVLIESIVKAHPETDESSTLQEDLNFEKKKQDSTKIRKNGFAYTGFFSIINYFAILALIDLLVLYTGLLGDIFTNLTQKSFKDYSAFLCKSLTFVGYLTSHLSSSVILFVSFIRFTAIYSPIWAAKLTNSYNIRKAISTLIFIFMMLNLHLFWNMNLVEFDVKEYLMENYNKRFSKNNTESDYSLDTLLNDTNLNSTKFLKCKLIAGKVVWPIIDKFVYSVIPFIFIIIFNTLIIVNINKAQTYRYLFYAANIKSVEFSQTSLNNIKMVDMKIADKKTLTTSLNFSNNNRNYLTAPNSFSSLKKKPSSIKSIANSNKHGGKNKQLSNEIKAKLESIKMNNLIGKRLTILLLSLSFGFLLCTFPIVFLFVFIESIQENINEIRDIQESNRALEWLHFAQRISSVFMYLNHSINFFIYFLTSQRFRQQFSRLFKRFKIKCQKNDINEWRRIKQRDIII